MIKEAREALKQKTKSKKDADWWIGLIILCFIAIIWGAMIGALVMQTIAIAIQ